MKGVIWLFLLTGILFCENTSFDSQKAIRHIRQLEKEWKLDHQNGASRYAGTEWLKAAATTEWLADSSIYDHYRNRLPDSLRICPLDWTHYAIEALRAGLGETDFAKMDSLHEKIWGKREYAGWSVAYLLTKHFGWTAIAAVYPYSEEFDQVKRTFIQKKAYPVWRQPDITLEALYELPLQANSLNKILKTEAFGWGFSIQGWHTWITHYDELWECNWWGSPSTLYEETGTKPLFIHTQLTEFTDYDSHVICFPPQN
jgi:hypothetical protein